MQSSNCAFLYLCLIVVMSLKLLKTVMAVSALAADKEPLCNHSTAPATTSGTTYSVVKGVLSYRCIDGTRTSFRAGPTEAACDGRSPWSQLIRPPECLVVVGRAGRARVEQSSGIFPEKALDKDKRSQHEGFRCARTDADDARSWWRLKLDSAVALREASLTLASDEPVPMRLEVRVGNASQHDANPLCHVATTRTGRSGLPLLFDCVAVGRIISISGSGSKGLTLCDVTLLAAVQREYPTLAACPTSVPRDHHLTLLPSPRRLCLYIDLDVRFITTSSRLSHSHSLAGQGRSLFGRVSMLGHGNEAFLRVSPSPRGQRGVVSRQTDGQ